MISKPPEARRWTVIHEIMRLWPAMLVLVISVAVFRGPTLLSVFWRLQIAALAFLAAHCLWKFSFGHLDLARHMTDFWDLVSKAQRGEGDAQAALAHAVIVLGISVFRAALYAAVILGVLMNIGGA